VEGETTKIDPAVAPRSSSDSVAEDWPDEESDIPRLSEEVPTDIPEQTELPVPQLVPQQVMGDSEKDKKYSKSESMKSEELTCGEKTAQFLFERNLDPYYPPWVIVVIYLVTGIMQLIIGASIGGDAPVSTKRVEYSDLKLGKFGYVDIEIEEDMKEPIYLYYELTNFHQNHKRFVNSKSDHQWYDGVEIELDPDFKHNTDCVPLIYTKDSNDKKRVRFPCGLAADNAFNDTFRVALLDGGEAKEIDFVQTREEISFNADGDRFRNLDYEDYGKKLDMWLPRVYSPTICQLATFPATASDSDELVVQLDDAALYMPEKRGDTGLSDTKCEKDDDDNHVCEFTSKGHDYAVNGKIECVGPTYEEVQNPAGWGMENAHFINWMRNAGLATFSKLYGRIEKDIDSGSTVRVLVSNLFPTDNFEGKKSLYLSTTNVTGTPNTLLQTLFFITGIASLVAALAWVVWILLKQKAWHEKMWKEEILW